MKWLKEKFGDFFMIVCIVYAMSRDDKKRKGARWGLFNK